MFHVIMAGTMVLYYYDVYVPITFVSTSNSKILSYQILVFYVAVEVYKKKKEV